MKGPTTIKGYNHHFIINQKSKKLIIFFTGTGAQPGHFFFYKAGQQLDCNILFINNGLNQWYQEGIPSLGTKTLSDTINILKDWIEYLNIDDVYTCGASMGAYGAILYGCYLNVNVLAFGPELTLLEEGSRSISYIQKDQKIHFNLLEIIKLSKNKIYIYVGEDDPIDIYQASKIPSHKDFNNVMIHSVIGVKHSVGQHLKNQNMLLLFLENFINDKELPIIKEEGRACTIKNFPQAYYKQFQEFKAKNWDKSIYYGIKATNKYPTSAYAQNMLGMAYLSSGDSSKALAPLSIARSCNPTNLDYQFSVANYMRRIGMLERARYLHYKILQIDKDFANSHYDLGILFSKLNDGKNALSRVRRAYKLEPTNASFKKQVANFEKKFITLNKEQ